MAETYDEYKSKGNFAKKAKEAGFSESQARFLEEHVAKRPHTHTADQITDLEDAVREIEGNG